MPTEGMETVIYRLVDGPFAGRELVHVPEGGRFGAVGWLVRVLLMDPREPIASDPERAAALLADLVRLRDEVLGAEPPTLPAEVGAVLDEALALDPRKLVKLIEMRSDHWGDDDLRELERRAQSAADPDLLRPLKWEVGAVLHRATLDRARHSSGGLAWQALYRAALGQLAPGLDATEVARLGERRQRAARTGEPAPAAAPCRA